MSVLIVVVVVVAVVISQLIVLSLEFDKNLSCPATTLNSVLIKMMMHLLRIYRVT